MELGIKVSVMNGELRPFNGHLSLSPVISYKHGEVLIMTSLRCLQQSAAFKINTQTLS